MSLRLLSVSSEHGGVAIFDDGVQRPTKTQAHTGSSVIEFSVTAGRLYGYNNESTEFGFRRLSVTDSGVTEVDVTRNLFSTFSADMVFEAGRMYASAGTVLDPEAPAVIGTVTFTIP